MAPKIGMIIFDIWLLWWLGRWAYHSFMLGADGKKRLIVGKMLHQFRHKRQWDSDLLKEEELAELSSLIKESDELIRTKADAKTVDTWMKQAGNRWQRLMREDKHHWPKELIEVLIVVIGVVMGLRGLYLQPFKIPTGSMQPTLFGIKFTDDEKLTMPNPLVRLLDGINYSRRYVDVVAREDVFIPLKYVPDQGIVVPGARPAPSIPVVSFFLPKTRVVTDTGNYDFPGDLNTVSSYLYRNHEQDQAFNQGVPGIEIRKGEVIARGYLELGDHLFVDRVSYQFRDPMRGDIVVFITDGIKARGHDMRGRYYIKRLVGLPGETLQIRDRRLFVKKAGDSDYRMVDGSDSPAFDRVASMKGGNRGYSNETRARYLRTPEETFELADDEYFMMGDNSENSSDGRFWGVVRREEIVGRGLVVYWPFLRRWGLPDGVPAEDFDSPPTR